MELGDILVGDEAEGRGIQVDFQVGTLNPTDLTTYTVATRGAASHPPVAKSKHEAKDTH